MEITTILITEAIGKIFTTPDRYNTAYFILVAIIEKIGTMAFHQAIENYIFKPAGLMNMNYFKPQSKLTVRLVDAIRKNGTVAFIQNPDEIFQKGDVPSFLKNFNVFPT